MGVDGFYFFGNEEEVKLYYWMQERIKMRDFLSRKICLETIDGNDLRKNYQIII